MSDIMKFMKAARKIAENDEHSSDMDSIRIAMLGDISLQHLTMALQYELHQVGIHAKIYESEYNGINMDVLDINSSFYQFQPQFITIFPHYMEVREYPNMLDDQEQIEKLCARVINYWKKIWEIIMERLPHAKILQCNYVSPPERLMGNIERQCRYSRTSFLQRVNEEMNTWHSGNVTIIDLDFLSSLVGKLNWFDYPAYFLNKLGLRLDFCPMIASTFSRIIRCHLGRIRKCLVLDLDNTLWGGTVGDDGWEGIRLDPNDPIGEAYRYFQQYILGLKERGVILAVCSKNEEETAKAPFLNNHYMLLTLDDISCFVANWENKATNLREIAKILNIGIDSLVFFDDNPVERDIVSRYLPEVLVIDVPDDPALYVTSLDAAAPFEQLDLTTEDLHRSQSYIANRKRTRLAEGFVDYGSYLKALDMKGRILEPSESQLARYIQLLNKSNQFNLRTQHYHANELQKMRLSPNCTLLAAELHDKFSDYGLISCVILCWQKRDCFIDSWVMSCRVLKRGVEYMMFQKVKELARKKNCLRIIGQYKPTIKNMIVKNFYETIGFVLERESVDGTKLYHFDINNTFQNECFIKRMD